MDIGIRPGQDTRLDASDRVSLTLALERLFEVARVDLVVLPEAGAFLALAVISGVMSQMGIPKSRREAWAR